MRGIQFEEEAKIKSNVKLISSCLKERQKTVKLEGTLAFIYFFSCWFPWFSLFFVICVNHQQFASSPLKCVYPPLIKLNASSSNAERDLPNIEGFAL
jgi:UDP-N-acetylglucosamine pyrophosphorylase